MNICKFHGSSKWSSTTTKQLPEIPRPVQHTNHDKFLALDTVSNNVVADGAEEIPFVSYIRAGMPNSRKSGEKLNLLMDPLVQLFRRHGIVVGNVIADGRQIHIGA